MVFGRWAAALALSSAFCVPLPGWAADGGSADSDAAKGDFASSLAAYLHAITDWSGERSRLEKAGLTFTFTYYGDAFANPVGGVQQGVGYDGRFGTIVDADLEKLLGWSGAAFHASVRANNRAVLIQLAAGFAYLPSSGSMRCMTPSR